MLELEIVITFLITCSLLSAIPAPDNTLIALQSVIRGKVAGLALTLGVCTGIAIHLVGVIYGLYLVVEHVPNVFVILKIVGALFLVYVAWRAIKESEGVMNLKDEGERCKSLYCRGLIMTVLNPASPFALAMIFSNYVSDCCDVRYQVAQLGILMIISVFIVFNFYAYIASVAGTKWVHSKKVHRRLTYFSAAAMAGWAIVILFASKPGVIPLI
jgi:threonine/homoserine/homoserine lactone efflux protein